MNFIPRTEKELEESRLLPKGVYDFEVITGLDKVSHANNQMIELKLKVTISESAVSALKGLGMEARSGNVVTDYLLAEVPQKLRHAAIACDLLDRYTTGSLVGADFVGKRGRLKLRVEKDKNGVYPPKNAVVDYLGSGPRRLLLEKR